MDRMKEVGELDFAHCDPFRNIKMEIVPSTRLWRRENGLDKMASTVEEVHGEITIRSARAFRSNYKEKYK